MKEIKLLNGNNIELLKTLEDNSIDSVVTDPPYGLSFMNKKWDYDVPSVEFWLEVFRVLKPGGHVLSFGGTRTYHRMVVNMEDAGFEIRDQIMWLYGSGFPKSLNIGKGIDKLQGNEREVIGGYTAPDGRERKGVKKSVIPNETEWDNEPRVQTKGNSPYEGYGTGLKPSNEPICMARKPISKKNITENVLEWGTGGINIDGCRVGNDVIQTNGVGSDWLYKSRKGLEQQKQQPHEGRFPANIILECTCDEVIKGQKGEVKKLVRKRKGFMLSGSEENITEANAPDNYNDTGDIHTDPNCPCRLLDEQSGVSKSVGGNSGYKASDVYNITEGITSKGCGFNDKGGASRFFYTSKVSKKERNMGTDKNNHPTVKPIQLMAYLVRLVTPPNGTVLDPFMGSGSTGISTLLEGFNFIGMEMDEGYFKIAESRINNYEDYRQFLKQNK